MKRRGVKSGAGRVSENLGIPLMPKHHQRAKKKPAQEKKPKPVEKEEEPAPVEEAPAPRKKKFATDVGDAGLTTRRRSWPTLSTR